MLILYIGTLLHYIIIYINKYIIIIIIIFIINIHMKYVHKYVCFSS